MMVPFPVLMIPLYSGVSRARLDRHVCCRFGLPAFFGSAFSIFLLRQFFLTIPNELSEAARIDGCSELAIFFRIILPLARPALSVVALFHLFVRVERFLGGRSSFSHPARDVHDGAGLGSSTNLKMAAASTTC